MAPTLLFLRDCDTSSFNMPRFWAGSRPTSGLSSIKAKTGGCNSGGAGGGKATATCSGSLCSRSLNPLSSSSFLAWSFPSFAPLSIFNAS